MERRLRAGWEAMERGKDEVLARVARHSPEERDRHPGPGRWSLGDVVEHLVRAEGGMGTALAKAPTPDRPRVVAPGRWYRFPLLRVALWSGYRIKAPTESILPTRELPWHALLSRWEEQRRALDTWLRGVDPRLLADPRFKHPIVGWLTIPQALRFAGDHLAHHLQQIGRIEREVAGG